MKTMNKKAILAVAVTLLLAAALFVGAGAAGAGDTGAEANQTFMYGGTSYSTFPDLVTAMGATSTGSGTAADPYVVTFSDDVDNGKGVFIGAGNLYITFNFNGKTFTAVSNPAGSAGYENQVFHIESGNHITMKNGTIEVSDQASAKFRMLVQNYSATMTYENMTFDGTNLADATHDPTSTYALSNNSGNVSITGTTSVTASKKAVANYAFDSCKYASYDAPTVTIDTTGDIIGAFEVTGGTLSITKGSFTDLANAVKYAASGATIKLADNVTDAKVSVSDGACVVIPAGKTLTLDLNGHTFKQDETVETSGGYVIWNKGELTLTDESEDADGLIEVSSKNYNTSTVRNDGNLTIENGQIKGYYIAVKNEGEDATITDAVLTINGGKLTSAISDSAPADMKVKQQAVQAWGTVNITGGTFDGTVVSWNQHGSLAGDTTITDGTFKEIVATDTLKKGSDWPTTEEAAKLTINGGTFEKGIKAWEQEVYLTPTKKDLDPERSSLSEIAVNGGSFIDLASAVKYATSGATITLAGNVTDAKVSDGACVVIPAGKTLTLDLNGHTFKQDEAVTASGGYVIWNKGTLTIDDLSVGHDGKIEVSSKNYNTSTVRNDGTLTIKNGEIVGYYIAVKNDGSSTTASMTINGGKLTSKISTSAPSAGQKKNQALQVFGGNVTVNDGNFDGKVIAWAHNSITNKSQLTINDGTFGMEVATNQYPDAGAAYPTADHAASITATGGDFQSFVEWEQATEDTGGNPEDLKPEHQVGSVISVSGGTVQTNPSKYLAPGYQWDPTTGEVTQIDYEAAIGDKKYATLAAAIDAAQAGDTIKLLRDVTDAQVKATATGYPGACAFIPAGKEIVLDLNGHKYEQKAGTAQNGGYVVLNLGTLTITDSSADAAGYIKVAESNSNTSTVRNDGTLTIEKGEIKGYEIAVKNSSTGTLEINGGTFTSVKTERNMAIQNWGTAAINNGTFEGKVVSWAYTGMPHSLITIENGTFENEVATNQYPNGSGVWPAADADEIASIVIENGTFEKEITAWQQDEEETHGNPQPVTPEHAECSDISVSGGLFSDLVSAVKYAADDATLILGANVTDLESTINAPADTHIAIYLAGKSILTQSYVTKLFNDEAKGFVTISGPGFIGYPDPSEFLATGFVWNKETWEVAAGVPPIEPQRGADGKGTVEPPQPVKVSEIATFDKAAELPKEVVKVSYAGSSQEVEVPGVDQTLAVVDINVYKTDGGEPYHGALTTPATVTFTVDLTGTGIYTKDKLAAYHGVLDEKTGEVSKWEKLEILSIDGTWPEYTITVIVPSFSPIAIAELTYSDPFYSITNDSSSKGTVDVAGLARSGETVTFTATPKSGYYISGTPVVKDSTGASVPDVKREAEGKYSFTMPAYNVTITVNFVKKSSGSGSGGSGTIWIDKDVETPTPTVTPTPTPTPVATPTVKQTDTQIPAKSPMPIIGILAGLGAAAVLFGLRRK